MRSFDVAAFHAGDHAVFKEIFALHSERLRRYIRRFTADPDEIDELLQRSWVRAYQHRLSFRQRGPFERWLVTVCRTECVGYVRSRKRAQLIHEGWGILVEREPHSEEDAVTEQILYAQAAKLVMALPKRQRTVVLLRIVAGRTTEQAAAELRCAQGTIRATLFQALQKLRTSMHTAPGLVILTSASLSMECLNLESALTLLA